MPHPQTKHTTSDFLKHLKGCFVTAREDHSTWGEWATFWGLVGFSVSPWLVKNFNFNLADHAQAFITHNAYTITKLGLGLLVVRAFWHSFCRYDELKIKQTRKFRIICNPKDDKCRTHSINGQTGRQVVCFRMRVVSDSIETIEDCSSYVETITKVGSWEELLKHDRLNLLFTNSPKEEMLSKNFSNGVWESFDVIWMETPAVPIIPSNSYPLSIDMGNMFKEPGRYIIGVIVKGKNARTETVNLVFTWTGKVETSELILLSKKDYEEIFLDKLRRP